MVIIDYAMCNNSSGGLSSTCGGVVVLWVGRGGRWSSNARGGPPLLQKVADSPKLCVST